MYGIDFTRRGFPDIITAVTVTAVLTNTPPATPSNPALKKLLLRLVVF